MRRHISTSPARRTSASSGRANHSVSKSTCSGSTTRQSLARPDRFRSHGGVRTESRTQPHRRTHGESATRGTAGKGLVRPFSISFGSTREIELQPPTKSVRARSAERQGDDKHDAIDPERQRHPARIPCRTHAGRRLPARMVGPAAIRHETAAEQFSAILERCSVADRAHRRRCRRPLHHGGHPIERSASRARRRGLMES